MKTILLVLILLVATLVTPSAAVVEGFVTNTKGAGVQGVTLDLYNALPEKHIATTVTDVDGFYRFDIDIDGCLHGILLYPSYTAPFAFNFEAPFFFTNEEVGYRRIDFVLVRGRGRGSERKQHPRFETPESLPCIEF